MKAIFNEINFLSIITVNFKNKLQPVAKNAALRAQGGYPINT